MLILALAAPSIAFSALLLLRTDTVSRSTLSLRAAQGVDAIADALDRELRGMVTNLSVLAASGWVEREEYDRLHARATEALSGTNSYLIAVDSDMQQILNTRVPWGTPLGQTSDPGSSLAAIKTGLPVVSDVFLGQTSQRDVFNVVLPIISGEFRAAALILTRDIDAVDKIFADSLPPPGWSYAILDTSGRRVAGEAPRSTDDELLSKLCGEGAPAGLVQERGEGGVKYSAASERLKMWNWRACVWTSSDQVAESSLQRWRSFAILALVLVAVTLLSGAALGQMLAGSIRRAASVGRALDAGGDVPEQRSVVREVDEVLGTLTRAARRRLQHEEDLKVLLKETAHRAKNQIAITTALVRLSARSADSVEKLRDDITARLAALGRSIDMMPATATGSVTLKNLVDTQLEPFAFDEPGRLVVRGGDVSLPPAIAQSLGLVLHEKATNASKYGAWSAPGGRVTVTWDVADGVLNLVWDEQGGPPASAPTRSGFGTSLVEMLIERTLGGKVERDYRQIGLVCLMHIPLDRSTDAQDEA